MSDWEGKVQTNELDLRVYGQVQYSFSVYDSTLNCFVGPKTLADACVESTTRRALVVEDEITVVSKGVEYRCDAVNALGNAMSKVLYVVAMMAGDNTDNNINNTIEQSCKEASGSETEASKCKKYVENALEIAMKYDNSQEYKNWYSSCTSGTMKKGDVSAFQSALKLTMDKENNALQQTTTDLQNIVSKRDSAYSTIGKVQKKIDKTMSNTVQALGS